MSWSRFPTLANLEGYKCVDLYERSGPGSGLSGIQILVKMGRPLSDKESTVIDRARESIIDAIDRESARLDVNQQIKSLDQAKSFIALFADQPIYSEPIPNEYCSRACCSQIPWWIFTTRRGRIKLGWRKSVILIDWSGSDISQLATELFPNEDVTMSDRYIHAWGYDKAREYVKKIMGAK